MGGEAPNLLGSGRAVGVVKRVTTAAIDGWIIKRDGDDRNVLHANDRSVLSSLMAVGQVFSYTQAFGEAYAFNLLSRLASAYRRYIERLYARDIDVILRNVRSEIEAEIRRNLGCAPEVVLATERMYLRCDYPAPIDQNVGLPSGFTREFVEEIEANLVGDSELDKFDLENHFAHLNPQKKE